MGREHEELLFHLTQILTGHDVFNSYLHRIGKADIPAYAHCDAAEDTAEHTLKECPAWKNQRAELCSVVRHNLSLSAIIDLMLINRQKWLAVATFCSEIMSIKEDAECVRQGQPTRGGVEHYDHHSDLKLNDRRGGHTRMYVCI